MVPELKKKLSECTGFEWDEGNRDKNRIKHRVSATDCEQIFFNHPLVVAYDQKHSEKENRYFALGHNDSGQKLFIVFTLRNKRIRVISARDMSRKEREVYDNP